VAQRQTSPDGSSAGSRSSEHDRDTTRRNHDGTEHERDASRPDRSGREPPAQPAGGGRLTAARAAQMGGQQIAEVTGRQVDGVAAVEPSDDGWVVGVEVVEDHRIPSSTDVLAIYQADLDQGGELLSYRRIKRYKRGQGGDGDYGGEG
jgi:gas vesicle protein GvpO